MRIPPGTRPTDSKGPALWTPPSLAPRGARTKARISSRQRVRLCACFRTANTTRPRSTWTRGSAVSFGSCAPLFGGRRERRGVDRQLGPGNLKGSPGPLLFAGVRGVAQPVSSADVCVLDYCEEVRVGVLIRWLFRVLLFRVLVGLWRIARRR